MRANEGVVDDLVRVSAIVATAESELGNSPLVPPNDLDEGITFFLDESPHQVRIGRRFRFRRGPPRCPFAAADTRARLRLQVR